MLSNSAQDSKQVKFLLVENDPDHAFIFAKGISRLQMGFQVIHCSSGQEALEYLRSCTRGKADTLPQAIFIDLKMPIMDGFDLLIELKKQNDLCDIPRIILSSSSTQEDIQKAYHLGACSYLVKPLYSDKFQLLIKSLSFYWGMLNQSLGANLNSK